MAKGPLAVRWGAWTLDDPRAGTRDAETESQWREGDSFAFAFPTAPAGRLLILFMGHRDEVRHARSDPEGYWARKLREHPGVAERIAGDITEVLNQQKAKAA